jgi:hypothetical protein
MSAPELKPTSLADSQPGAPPRGSFFRRLWKRCAFLRKGCAPLGLLLVFIIEIFIVPLFDGGDNFLPIKLEGWMHRFSVGYTFVDIDTFAFSEWKAGDHTNRSKIRGLIELAANNSPKAIVVDIDLSDRNIDKNDDGTPDLINYVNKYFRDEDKNNRPLIFVQSLQRRPKSSEQTALEAVGSLVPASEFGGPIYFGSSGFLRSADGKVRSWRLAEPACVKDQIKTIPSVELLLLPIRRKESDPSEGTLDPSYVKEKIQGTYHGEDCSSVRTIMHEIRLGEDQLIRLSSRNLRDRIIYTMQMPPGRWENNLIGHLRYAKANDDLLQMKNGKDLFTDRIVVIGGSNDESRDIYDTPYGPMPGAVVLINAIESLRTHLQIRELRDRVEITTSIIIGILMWFFLELLRVELGPFVLGLFGYLPALIISALLLYFGIWFNLSGVIVGGIAHLISKLFCNIGHDIWKDPQHKVFKNLRAKES